MEVLTPASPSDLPPLGELVADEPSWRYPPATTAGAGAAHLRVWLTTGPEPGHLAVVTETGPDTSATKSAGRIRAVLARRYGPSVVLLEHYLAPELGEGMETLDLVPDRRRRQPPLVPRVADPGGQSPSRRARGMDGRLRAPDHQQAR
jgi:hypothetical protein